MDVIDSLLASPLIQALCIVGASLVCAWLTDRVFMRVLGRWASKTRNETDELLVAAFHRPVAWTVFVCGAWLAAHRIAVPEPIPFFRDGVLFGLLTLYWTKSAAWALGQVLQHYERNGWQGGVTRRTRPMFSFAGNVIIWGFGTYFFFLAWDIDVTAWIAGAGVVGVAVGFAAQDTLGNLIAGIFILTDAPYALGDFLQLENGTRGRVTQIGIRTTRLMTLEGIEVIVPNSTMANSMIVNESGGPTSQHRIHVAVSVSYDSDIQVVREELLAAARGVAGVSLSPEALVCFVGFGASGLDFELRVWVERPEYRWLVLDMLNTAIFERFRAADIEIPYDKLDLYVKSAGDDPVA